MRLCFLSIGTKKSPLLLISLSNNGDFLIFKNSFYVNLHLFGALHKLCLFQFFCKSIICLDDRFAKHQTDDQGNT